MMKKVSIPNQPWTRSPQEILKTMTVYKDKGLDAVQVPYRSELYGSEAVHQPTWKSDWKVLATGIKVWIVLLLVVTIALLFLLGKWLTGITLLVIAAVFAMIDFLVRKKSVANSLEAKESNSISAKVRRDGQTQEFPAEELLPGDIVLLEPGDVVPSDLRLIEVSNLKMDESAFTGDATPVAKQIETLEVEVPLTQRTNMAFKGTSVVSGSGEGIVVTL
jgi:Ca2+-transporting ATPase